MNAKRKDGKSDVFYNPAQAASEGLLHIRSDFQVVVYLCVFICIDMY